MRTKKRVSVEVQQAFGSVNVNFVVRTANRRNYKNRCYSPTPTSLRRLMNVFIKIVA